ncbi:hypothetical protein OBCHQ24_13850 [Oceanobacillus iheyensis]|nr:hypothetical protein OBCHQ24_13850 [Oceanobacillus iheyensis]
MLTIIFILIPLFLIALYITLKFTWGKEGKSKQGEEILKKSSHAIVPIFPIGWLLLEIAHSIFDISYTLYRDSLGLLVGIYFIVQGIMIYYYKNKKWQIDGVSE